MSGGLIYSSCDGFAFRRQSRGNFINLQKRRINGISPPPKLVVSGNQGFCEWNKNFEGKWTTHTMARLDFTFWLFIRIFTQLECLFKAQFYVDSFCLVLFRIEQGGVHSVVSRPIFYIREKLKIIITNEIPLAGKQKDFFYRFASELENLFRFFGHRWRGRCGQVLCFSWS